MSALDEVVSQIGTRYLPKGMKANDCPIHGKFLAHYTDSSPICPTCNEVLTSTNQGNGESATATQFFIDLQQDQMHRERLMNQLLGN